MGKEEKEKMEIGMMRKLETAMMSQQKMFLLTRTSRHTDFPTGSSRRSVTYPSDSTAAKNHRSCATAVGDFLYKIKIAFFLLPLLVFCLSKSSFYLKVDILVKFGNTLQGER